MPAHQSSTIENFHLPLIPFGSKYQQTSPSLARQEGGQLGSGVGFFLVQAFSSPFKMFYPTLSLGKSVPM